MVRTETREIPLPEGIEVVLLDVGNVLADDYWETILLTPGDGLADRLGLESGAVADAGLLLWDRYCRRVADEAEYWRDLAAELGCEVPEGMPAELDALVRVNPDATELFSRFDAAGVATGIVSNNTAFWYAKQADRLRIGAVTEPELVFLSHEHGCTKADEPSLFDVAAEHVDPRRVLLVDDRPGNIEAARRRGFQAHRYAMAVQR